MLAKTTLLVYLEKNLIEYQVISAYQLQCYKDAWHSERHKHNSSPIKQMKAVTVYEECNIMSTRAGE